MEHLHGLFAGEDEDEVFGEGDAPDSDEAPFDIDDAERLAEASAGEEAESEGDEPPFDTDDQSLDEPPFDMNGAAADDPAMAMAA